MLPSLFPFSLLPSLSPTHPNQLLSLISFLLYILRETIWRFRVEAIQKQVLSRWSHFTIWNAGKQGRRLYRALSTTMQNKVNVYLNWSRHITSTVTPSFTGCSILWCGSQEISKKILHLWRERGEQKLRFLGRFLFSRTFRPLSSREFPLSTTLKHNHHSSSVWNGYSTISLWSMYGILWAVFLNVGSNQWGIWKEPRFSKACWRTRLLQF